MSEEEREESAAGKGGEADAKQPLTKSASEARKRKGVWGKPKRERRSEGKAREAQPDREGSEERTAAKQAQGEERNAQESPARQGI